MENQRRKTIQLIPFSLAILVTSVLANMEKYNSSILKLCAHSIFQTITLILLFSLLIKRRYLFNITLFIFIFDSFISYAYNASISISVTWSIINSNANEIIEFISSNIIAISLFFCLFCSIKYTSPPIFTKKYLISCITVSFLYLAIPTMLHWIPRFQSDEFSEYLSKERLKYTARGIPNYVSNFALFFSDLGTRFFIFKYLPLSIDSYSFALSRRAIENSWTQAQPTSSSPKLVVLMIGESLRAENMSIYGDERKTTPLLEERVMRGEIKAIPNAYSAGTNTWASLPSILTLNDPHPNIGKSIVSFMEKSGYETYWISTQGEGTIWDQAVSAIARQSNHVHFIKEKNNKKYDLELVESLRKLEYSAKNKFVVLHMLGSHEKFSDRYPSEFDVFKANNRRLDEYDNSVIYSDFVIDKAVELTKKHNGLFIFISDHGLTPVEDSISLKHDIRDDPNPSSLRVPYLVSGNVDITTLKDPMSLYNFLCSYALFTNVESSDIKQVCNNNGDKILYFDSKLNLRTLKPH